MTARLAMFTIDCDDPATLATFYGELLSLEIAHSSDDYAMLVGAGPALGFGRVDGYRPPEWPNPNGSKQFHLDLAVDDIAAAEAQAIGLGATVAEPQPGATWRVLLDPSGHPFCLTDAKNWA